SQGLTAQSTWTPPRMPDGHPDFQGVWVNNIATPLERPEALAGRPTLTDKELAAMKKKAHEMFSGNGDAAFAAEHLVRLLLHRRQLLVGERGAPGKRFGPLERRGDVVHPD